MPTKMGIAAAPDRADGGVHRNAELVPELTVMMRPPPIYFARLRHARQDLIHPSGTFFAGFDRDQRASYAEFQNAANTAR